MKDLGKWRTWAGDEDVKHDESMFLELMIIHAFYVH